jgi:hypothetical protein
VLAWVSTQHGESAMPPCSSCAVRSRVRAGDNSGAPPVLRVNHTGRLAHTRGGGAFEVSTGFG